MLRHLAMNTAQTFAIAACLALNAPTFAAAPKPKKAPPKKPAPSLTVKDVALREAKTCDANRNGKIDPAEMTPLRMTQSKNPKSYLYLFDDNNNKYLDDSEIAKIQFAPAPGKAGGAKPGTTHQMQPKKKKE